MRALIDGDIIVYSVATDKKQSLEDLEVEGVISQVDRTEEEVKNETDEFLNKLLINVGAVTYNGFLTGKNNFRKEYSGKLVKDYKANRPTEKPKWFQLVRDHLVEKWGFIVVDRIEADDALSICMGDYDEHSTCCSIDKDLLQIPGKHYNFRKNMYSTITEEVGDFLFWRQMLMGDPGDNVQGIPRVGEKTAEKILAKVHQDSYYNAVLDEYVRYYNQDGHEGINNFLITYHLLKLISFDDHKIDWRGFEIPEPLVFNKPEIMKTGNIDGVDLPI